MLGLFVYFSKVEGWFYSVLFSFGVLELECLGIGFVLFFESA